MTTPQLPHILPALTSTNGPAITFYGGGERSELGGGALAKWLTKTVNLLRQEDVTSLTVDLPAHWRTLIWVVSAKLTATPVTLATPPATALSSCAVGTDGGSTVLVTADPLRAEAATWDFDQVWLQSLGALALAWDGPQVAGTLDAIAAVSSQADALHLPLTPGAEPTLPPTFPTLPAGGRLAVAAAQVGDVLAPAIWAWATGSHLVWVAEGDLDRVAQLERADATWEAGAH